MIVVRTAPTNRSHFCHLYFSSKSRSPVADIPVLRRALLRVSVVLPSFRTLGCQRFTFLERCSIFTVWKFGNRYRRLGGFLGFEQQRILHGRIQGTSGPLQRCLVRVFDYCRRWWGLTPIARPTSRWCPFFHQHSKVACMGGRCCSGFGVASDGCSSATTATYLLPPSSSRPSRATLSRRPSHSPFRIVGL